MTYHSLILKLEKFIRTDIRYILHGGSWLLLGQIIGTISSLLLAVAYAHVLSKETYGIYKYILSVVGILSLFSLSGMDTAAQKGIAEGKEGVFWKAFRLRVLFSSGAVVSALVIGLYYLLNENHTLGILFLVIAPFLFLFDASAHYGTLFIGKKLFKENAKCSGLLQLSSALLMFLAVYFSKNIFIIIGIYFLGNVSIRSLIFLYAINRYPLNDIEDDTSLQFGKHLSIVNILATISSRLDAILLFHFLGPVALAVYSFAQAAATNIQTAFKLITTTLAFPKFASQEKAIIKRTLLRKVYLAHFFTIPLAVVAMLLIPLFFHYLFPAYRDSIHYAQAMIGLLAFSPLRFISTAITAKASTKTYYTLALSNSIINSICLLICVPLWGIWGAIIATGIQQSISNMLGLYLFKRM